MMALEEGGPISAGKEPPYKAKAIANYFLGKAKEEGKSLTQMKLQKLIYFAHGWHLALYDRPLIDERIQAWDFGPVVRTVYDEFKHYGREPISSLADSLEMTGTKLRFFYPLVNSADSRTISLLDRVWDVYKGLSAFQLSKLTHKADTPWEKTYSANRGVRNLTIEDSDIKDFFAKKGHDSRERRTAAG